MEDHSRKSYKRHLNTEHHQIKKQNMMHTAADNNKVVGDNLTLLQNVCLSGTTEALYYAIKQENDKYVRMYLDKGASIEVAFNELGHTALHLAVIVGKISIVMDLLNYGANWNAIDVNGACVLHIALKYKHKDLYGQTQNPMTNMVDTWDIESAEKKAIEILKIFLDMGFDVNINDNDHRSILSIALEKRMDKVIEFLIDRGANVNHCDKYGNSLIHHITTYALQNPNHEVTYTRLIAFLISKGANVDHKNENGETPIYLSAMSGLEGITFILLQHTNDVNLSIRSQTILHIFVEIIKRMNVLELIGKYELPDDIDVYNAIERLIKNGAPIDAEDDNGFTPLHVAVKYCIDEKLIKLLLQYSNNIDSANREGNTMIHTLIENYITRECNRSRCLRVLNDVVRKGADVNKSNEIDLTALHICISKNLIEIFDAVKEKINFHILNKNGDNALHFACKTHELDEKIINFMLMQGYDVTQPNRDGLTPIHLASQSDNRQIINILLDQGVDVNCRENRLYRTPLHMAAEANNFKAMKLLLGEGADIDAKDTNGKTVLLKIDCRQTESIRMLLQFGADLDAKDNEDRDLLYNTLELDEDFDMKYLYNFGVNINNLKFDTKPIDKMTIWFKHKLKCYQFNLQILKLEMANLPLAKIYKCYTGKNGEQNFFRHFATKRDYNFKPTLRNERIKCRDIFLKEITRMKDFSLNVGSLSLYDFLHIPLSRQIVHLKNENLSRLVNTSSYIESAFPEYCGIIRACYREILTSQSLWEPANEALRKLCNFDIPDLCVENIFNYLNNDDFKSMINSSS